jgi:hypothetical protein
MSLDAIVQQVAAAAQAAGGSAAAANPALAAAAAAQATPPPAAQPVVPVQAVAAAAGPPPVVAPAPPSVPLEHFTALQTRLADLEAKDREREAANRAAEIKALEAEGKYRQAFDVQREQARTELEGERKRLKEVEDRARNYALDGELARALAAQPLVAGGAEQLTQLLRSKFTVQPLGNGYAVQSEDFRSPGDFIGAMLGRPEYAHFLRAQNPAGGTGAIGGQSTPTPAGNPALPVEPKNFSEAILMQHAAKVAQGAVDARLTPTVPFGLPGTRVAATKTG